MRETYEQLVARVNQNAFIPNEGVTIMAKPVKLKQGKEFTFRAAGGVASKYPWDEWFNGDLLMLERSHMNEDGNGVKPNGKKDYDVETDAMGPKIKVVQISKLDADGNKLADALIIKARDMTADERQAEDIKRAEEKEARKAAGDDAPLNVTDQEEAAA